MRQTAKRCGIPALTSPFGHRPTRDYHPSACTWSTDGLRACSHALDCKTAAESWSDRASFPRNGDRSAHRGVLNMQRDVMRNVYHPHPTRARCTTFFCPRSNTHERILGVAIGIATGVPEVHWGRLYDDGFHHCAIVLSSSAPGSTTRASPAGERRF